MNAPQTEAWWDGLTPDQSERLNALVDSRVRLLGEAYSTAVERCTRRISDDNRRYVLGEA